MTREEAIETIRKNMPSDKSSPIYEALRIIIPELKESKDERIRKDIVALIKFALEDGSAVSLGSSTTKEEALAYLEKQKPINNSTREKIISRATSEKQVVLISESNGEAEIGYDTRSLEDAKKIIRVRPCVY